MEQKNKIVPKEKDLSNSSMGKDGVAIESRTEELLRINSQLESEIRERKAAQEALQMQNNHLEALQAITLDIVGQLETKKLLKSIITKAGSLLDTKDGYVALVDGDSQKLIINVAIGEYSKVLNNHFETDQGVCGRVLVTGEPLLIESYNDWEERVNHPLFNNLNSIIGAPLKKGDETFGVLGFGYFNQKKIGEYELNLLTSFAKLASITLSNANLISEINMQLSEKERVEKEKQEIFKQLLHSQKMEAIGTLAGGIAHDMNNILMAIQGNVSLIKLKTDEITPEYKRINNISDLVDSGSKLTQQILGFARGGKYKVETTDVNLILKKSCDVFCRTRKNINVHEDYSENIWAIEADNSQIEQVLLNLFVNAYHAMPGNGDLYIKTDNCVLSKKDVSKLMGESGKYVKISVRDTGKGMSSEVMERIFEPFFTTKAMGECSGLGLASAYGIIKNHNGIIDVNSKPEKGTTFNIYLPASDKTHREELIYSKERVHGNERILLIDDEEFVRDICKDYLNELGYKNICVSSGEKGIEIYKNQNKDIDMVIIDLVMPNMSGQDTFEELKKINQNVKVLLSSGYSLEAKTAEILDQADFIQKPFNITDFSNKIRDVLRN